MRYQAAPGGIDKSGDTLYFHQVPKNPKQSIFSICKSKFVGMTVRESDNGVHAQDQDQPRNDPMG